MKKRSITYYTKRVIIIDKLIDNEENKLIKVIYKILKRYYTHKWEVYYDEKKKKSNKEEKGYYKRRFKEKEVSRS